MLGEKIKTLFSRAILMIQNEKTTKNPTTKTILTKLDIPADIEVISIEKPKVHHDDDAIYTIVEKMPLFHNAKDQSESVKLMNDYISERIKNDNPQGIGKVYTRIIVNREGEVTQVKLLRGISPALNSLAIKYVSEMPKWIPGEQRGQKVSVSLNIPVRFE